MKAKGRETGRKCVIVDVSDKSFVLVTGPKSITGVKRRRVNVNHIKPLEDKIEVNRDASDEEIEEALKTQNKLEDMKQAA